MLDINSGHRNARQQQAHRSNGIADKVANKQDNKEEDELNYASLPHLSLFLSLSPSSPPWLPFSCPTSSALPAMAAVFALLFPRGSPSPALPRAAALVP